MQRESLEMYIEKHGIDLGSKKVMLLNDTTITLDRHDGIRISNPHRGSWRAHSMDELYWLNRLKGAQRG